jgi:nickel transport protein
MGPVTRRHALGGLAAALVAVATPAAAHQLNVFAFVEDGQVVVEAKFSTGKIPVAGEVRIFDAAGTRLDTLPLDEDGTRTFPLDPAHAEGGLLIEVEVNEGHDNYWILTPEDIARGMETD